MINRSDLPYLVGMALCGLGLLLTSCTAGFDGVSAPSDESIPEAYRCTGDVHELSNPYTVQFYVDDLDDAYEDTQLLAGCGYHFAGFNCGDERTDIVMTIEPEAGVWPSGTVGLTVVYTPESDEEVREYCRFNYRVDDGNGILDVVSLDFDVEVIIER